MTTIVTRTAKGSPLSWIEADANFTNLNADKLEASVITAYETSSHADATYLPINTAASTYLTQIDADTLYRTKTSLSANTGSTLVGFQSTKPQATARTIQTKLQDFTNALDFGVIGDGLVDDTVALQNAIDSISEGGTLYIPSGKYRLTQELNLYSGVSVIGNCSADTLYGAPPSSSSKPTYLFQESSNKSVFFIGGGLSNISIKNMAFGATKDVVINDSPVVGTYGIRCEGSFPQHSWFLRFEDLVFYNLERGLSINDPYAQTNPPPHTYDWNCCPILMANCRFLYPQIGIYINTNNCDFSTFMNCSFNVPSNGSGVHLKCAGYLRFINCSGGGNSINNNVLFDISATGTTSMDNLTLEGCQAETLTQFIRMLSGGTNTNRFSIMCRDCISEMSSDIYLAGNVHLITENCRFAVNIYVDSPNVRLSSKDDFFSSGYGYLFLNANVPSGTFINFRAGPNPPSNMSGISYDEGKKTFRSTSVPTSGYYSVGDRCDSTSSVVGSPVGWHCVAAGNPGTWVPYGQFGYRTNAGSPINVITPLYSGEELFDTTNLKWYKSRDLDGSHWLALN